MPSLATRGRLEGRVAIITGAGQGIGEGAALAFAKEGANLVITGRTMSKLERVAERIRAVGGKVHCLELTAGIRGDAERTVAEAMSVFGRLDILLNNAHSFTDPAPLESLTDADVRTHFDSGLLGSLQLMQCAFPHMRDGGGGSIVNFGSVIGYRCEAGYMAYAAAKEAIRTLTKTAAREWGKYKIRVNTIQPTAITDSLHEYLEKSGTYEQERARIALGYIGESEADVGPILVFLASDDSHYMSGQSIAADGGVLMH